MGGGPVCWPTHGPSSSNRKAWRRGTFLRRMPWPDRELMISRKTTRDAHSNRINHGNGWRRQFLIRNAGRNREAARVKLQCDGPVPAILARESSRSGARTAHGRYLGPVADRSRPALAPIGAAGPNIHVTLLLDLDLLLADIPRDPLGVPDDPFADADLLRHHGILVDVDLLLAFG